MVWVGVFDYPLLSPSGDLHPISGCSDQSLQQAANFLITLPINSAKFVRCEVWPYMGAFSMIWIPPDPLDHPIHLITHRFLAKLVFRTWPFRHCFIFTWLCTTYILDAVLHVSGYWRYKHTSKVFFHSLYLCLTLARIQFKYSFQMTIKFSKSIFLLVTSIFQFCCILPSPLNLT